MKYALLIYDDENVWASMTPEESGALFGEYMQFTNEVQASGHMKAGEALQPIATASSVRLRNGQLQTTDGPFAETREQLGGFYIVDAANLDEAIAIAARIPSVRLGTIEVRPVMVMPSTGVPVQPEQATATA